LSYYTDVKGFRVLSTEETKQYITVERPKIVKIQMAKANAINTLRRVIDLDPALKAGLDPNWENDLDHMTVVELEAQIDEIRGMPTTDGRPRRILRRLPRFEDADARRADEEAERLMAGVETTAPRQVVERFTSEIPQPQKTRTVEITSRNAAQFMGA